MVFLGSVSWPGIPAPPVPGVSAPPELRLVQACVEKSRGNVMISPFSLYEVLRYMLPGAAGETGKQMEAVLPGNGATGKEWSFLSEDFSRSWRCYSASCIFADPSVKLKEDYVKAVGADRVVPAPFRESMAEAVRQVNAWAAENTGNRIRNLLNPQEISGRTVLVPVSAVYMKAFWDSRFEEKTTAGTFFREDGSSCIMPMMKQQVFTEGNSWPRQGGMYDEKEGVRAASLFFAGGEGGSCVYGRSASEGEKAETIHCRNSPSRERTGNRIQPPFPVAHLQPGGQGGGLCRNLFQSGMPEKGIGGMNPAYSQKP